MNSIDANEKNYLFILSNDFGEIGVALYFILGQSFVHRSTLLIPEKRFKKLQISGSFKVASYNSLDDIISEIDNTNPAVVFLFSGYLFQQVLPLSSFKKLINYIEANNGLIATTDPLLGLIMRLEVSMVDVDLFFKKSPFALMRLWHKLKTYFVIKKLAPYARLLKNATHVYPHPIVNLQLPNYLKTASFFNEKILTHSVDNHCIEENDGANRAMISTKKKWFFVISDIDLTIQSSLHGYNLFVELLSTKLNEAISLNIFPVLIAPSKLIKAISSKFDNEKLLLYSDCPYDKFSKLLVEAEYAFYWNMYSASIITRILHKKSIFFFDKGHVSRILKPFGNLALDCIYGGMNPIFLEIDQKLEINMLIEASKKSQAFASHVFNHWHGSPNPENALISIISKS